jgi:hypothetical protein
MKRHDIDLRSSEYIVPMARLPIPEPDPLGSMLEVPMAAGTL